jgi:hypothetical protein
MKKLWNKIIDKLFGKRCKCNDENVISVANVQNDVKVCKVCKTIHI